MKTSLKNRIVKYLETCNCWVSGDIIEKKAQQAGHKASYGARQARLAVEEGLIQKEERKTKTGKTVVWYAPLNKEKPKQYKIIYEPVRKPDGRMVAIPKKIEV